MERSCNRPSICSLCLIHEETSFHIYFEYNFTVRLWNCLFTTININIHYMSLDNFWNLCNRAWYPLCHTIILANITNVVYNSKNQSRFINGIVCWDFKRGFFQNFNPISGINPNEHALIKSLLTSKTTT